MSEVGSGSCMAGSSNRNRNLIQKRSRICGRGVGVPQGCCLDVGHPGPDNNHEGREARYVEMRARGSLDPLIRYTLHHKS
jgi:hypothetical protein